MATAKEILIQVKMEATKAIAQSKAMSQGMLQLAESIEDATEPMNKMRGAVDSVSDQLGLFGKVGNDARAAIEDMVDPARRLAVAQRQIAHAAAAVRNPLNQMRDGFTSMKLEAAGLVGGLDNLNLMTAAAGKVASLFATALKVTLAAALALAAGIGATLVTAIKKYIGTSKPAQKETRALSKGFDQLLTAIGGVVAGGGRLEMWLRTMRGPLDDATQMVVVFKNELRIFSGDVVRYGGTVIKWIVTAVTEAAGAFAFLLDAARYAYTKPLKIIADGLASINRMLYFSGAISKETYAQMADGAKALQDAFGGEDFTLSKQIKNLQVQTNAFVDGLTYADTVASHTPLGRLVLGKKGAGKAGADEVKEVDGAIGHLAGTVRGPLTEALQFMRSQVGQGLFERGAAQQLAGFMGGFGEIAQSSFGMAREAVQGFTSAMQASQAMINTLGTGLVNIGAAAGAGLGGLLVGAKAGDAGIKQILDSLGSLAIQMGTMLVLAGSGFAALPGFVTAGAAIGYGSALIVAGGAMKGGASLMGAGGGGRASSAASTGGFTAPDIGTQSARDTRSSTTILMLNGEILGQVIEDEVDKRAALNRFVHIPTTAV